MDNLLRIKQIALSVLSRRKKWLLLVTALALLVFVPLAFVMSKEPPRHRTAATILIENRPDPAPVFQEFSPQRPLAVQLAILHSRSLAEAVIEALPRASVEDLVENPYHRDYALEIQNWVRRSRGLEPIVESPQRRALAELQQARVRFTPQGNSGIVEIRAEASKPRVAVDIANTYIEVLLSRTRAFNVDDTKSTRDYLEQQLQQANQSLAASEETLRRFNAGRGGIKVPERSAVTVARLSDLENTLAEVQANKKLSQARLTAMKAKLAALPPAPPPALLPAPKPPPPAPSPRTQMLRAKLAALERDLLEYEAKYTDEHPRVIMTRDSIADVRRELGDAVKDSPPVAAAAVAPAVPAQDRSAFAETVAALETAALSLDAQEEALKNQVANLRNSLSGLSRDELEYTRLTTEVESNRRLRALLAEKLGGARIREQGEMKVVKVIDPPGYPYPAGNEKRLRFLAIAVALALVVGAGLPTMAEHFNRPVESEDDVRHLTGLPVLAVVPLIRSRRPIFASSNGDPERARQDEHFLFAEAFRRLRVEIQLLGRDMPLRRLLVASAVPGEGKSTVVINLGLAFGEIGKHVIIADADFHRPTLHRTMKTSNGKGFTDLLAGTSDLGDSMSPIAEGVWLAPRGGSPSALTKSGLGSERLPEVLERMAAEADYVLLDSSPILLIPDNLYMAAATDGVLLVVHSGNTRPRDLLRTKEILEKSGTPIVGVVLNQMPLRSLTRYYDYYRHYKKYRTAETRA